MTAPDVGAANGSIPVEPTRCTCKHLVSLHAINGKGMRATCSATTARLGRCDCRLFVKAGASR